MSGRYDLKGNIYININGERIKLSNREALEVTATLLDYLNYLNYDEILEEIEDAINKKNICKTA